MLEKFSPTAESPASRAESWEPSTRMPTQDELPYSEPRIMESECHALQMPLMRESLMNYWQHRDDFYVGMDMFVYFSESRQKRIDFCGPDVFVVTGVKQHPRKSYLVWEEGKAPDVVIEFISESTAAIDKGSKMKLYQDRLRVPEYFWCDPYSDELQGFALKNGAYQPIQPLTNGVLPCAVLGLALTRWKGAYQRVDNNWLRWATLDGVLLPTSSDQTESEVRQKLEFKKSAEEERQRAEEANQRAAEAAHRVAAQQIENEKLRALLLKAGVNPDV